MITNNFEIQKGSEPTFTPSQLEENTPVFSTPTEHLQKQPPAVGFPSVQTFSPVYNHLTSHKLAYTAAISALALGALVNFEVELPSLNLFSQVKPPLVSAAPKQSLYERFSDLYNFTFYGRNGINQPAGFSMFSDYAIQFVSSITIGAIAQPRAFSLTQLSIHATIPLFSKAYYFTLVHMGLNLTAIAAGKPTSLNTAYKVSSVGQSIFYALRTATTLTFSFLFNA